MELIAKCIVPLSVVPFCFPEGNHCLWKFGAHFAMIVTRCSLSLSRCVDMHNTHGAAAVGKARPCLLPPAFRLVVTLVMETADETEPCTARQRKKLDASTQWRWPCESSQLRSFDKLILLCPDFLPPTTQSIQPSLTKSSSSGFNLRPPK